MVAIALTFATYAAASGTYYFLAFKPIPFARTLLVQLAAMAVNRLLPAGIGALGVNYLYLKREEHSSSQAISMVAVNNLLGILGHGLLVAVTLLLLPGTALSGMGRHRSDNGMVLEAIAFVGVVLIICGLFFGRRKLAGALDDIKRQLLSYRHRPGSLLAGLGSSMILTLCNVLCLYVCLYALGLHLSFAAVLLVFTFGAGTGAAVPTPGGLGGFEAGLAAGFVAYGIDPAQALAAALLYRLVSYWLPLVGGVLAFIVCQRRKMFGI